MLKTQPQVVLTPQQVAKDDKKYNQLKKVTFAAGGYTEIHKKFRPSKVEEMILDLADFLREYEKGGATINDEAFSKFITLHIIKHFSTLCPEFPSDFAEKLDFMDKLTDHECVRELAEKFDEKEVSKVYNIIIKTLENYVKAKENQEALRKQLSKKIKGMENAELLEKVFLGESS